MMKTRRAKAFRDQSLDDILATRSKAVVLASDTSGGALESLSSATLRALQGPRRRPTPTRDIDMYDAFDAVDALPRPRRRRRVSRYLYNTGGG